MKGHGRARTLKGLPGPLIGRAPGVHGALPADLLRSVPAMTFHGQAVRTHDHNREAHPLCNTSDKLAPRGADTATTDTVAPLIVGQRRVA